MERDFMGLSLKDPLAMVKEEILNEAGQDSGFVGSGVPWAYSSKVSAVPHLMSYKAAHDQDKALKLSSEDRMAGFVPPIHSVGEIQVGNHFLNSHHLGGVASQSIYPQTAAEPWNNPKSAGSPQLTIFYAGAVNVYNHISPAKVQAIMFMAANGVSNAKSQVGGLDAKLVGNDVINRLNQSLYSQHCPSLSSPLSLSSRTGAQSGSGSTCTDELIVAKTPAFPTTPMSKAEPPRVVNTNTIGSMIAYAVPQSRKASLARFLEKRKERVMNAAPYNLLKKSDDYGGSSEAKGADV